ncbi:MAG: hypothetical protein HRF50_10610 [Phycisphaerae bacterium]
MTAAALAILASLLDPLIGTLFALPHLSLFRRRERRWNSARRRRRGLAIVLGGIEGPSLAQHAVAAGLIRGGWRGAVEIQRWNSGLPLVRCFINLMSAARHERAAAALREHIREYQREHPDRPIHLVGISAGCWIVVRATARLDADEAVDAAVLLAPAVSQSADFDAAARRCRAGVHIVRSPWDFMMLGVCTTIFGTADRVHGPCAGWLGLRRTTAGVTEHVWRRAWARHGYLGSHCTATVPAFIAGEVAPLLRGAGAPGYNSAS